MHALGCVLNINCRLTTFAYLWRLRDVHGCIYRWRGNSNYRIADSSKGQQLKQQGMGSSPLETQTADAANETQLRLNRGRLVAVFRDYKLRQEVVLPLLACIGLHASVQEGEKRRGYAAILQQQRQTATEQGSQQSCFSWPWLA